MSKHSENTPMEDLKREVCECKKCRFPADRSKDLRPIFMEGNCKAKIWVIGLNPKLEENRDPNPSEFSHSYFHKIQAVFPEGIQWGSDAAHVDLVKCATKRIGKDFGELVTKCGDFLERQIKLAKPKLIIANGIPVCQWFLGRDWERVHQNDTSVLFNLGDFETLVLLSGFIGRMDQYSKTRLRQELQQAREKLGLGSKGNGTGRNQKLNPQSK